MMMMMMMTVDKLDGNVCRADYASKPSK